MWKIKDDDETIILIVHENNISKPLNLPILSKNSIYHSSLLEMHKNMGITLGYIVVKFLVT